MYSQKRVSNEIKKFWDPNQRLHNRNNTNNSDLNTVFIKYTNNRKVLFFLFFNNDKISVKVVFDFKDTDYPFKSPKVTINNYTYKNLLNIKAKWYPKFNITRCPCCESIMCQWYAPYTMKHILDEIKVNLNIKIKIVELMHCEKIVNKYIGHYVPIDTFL